MENRRYLGDGVYVKYDGGYRIAVNHHENEVVVLEEEVFERLIQFREDIIREIKEYIETSKS